MKLKFRAAIEHFREDNLREAIRNCLKWVDWEARIPPGSRIYIKPNLTFPEYRPGVTTSPHFIATLLGFHSKIITYLVYMSPLKDWMRRLVRFLRRGSRQADEYYTGIIDPNEPG